MKILLVHTSQMICNMAEGFLINAGYEVAAFIFPVEAVDYLKENKVDIMILENEMEVGLNIDQFIQEVKNEMKIKAPFMVIAYRELNQRACEAVLVLEQPFTQEELIDDVNCFADQIS